MQGVQATAAPEEPAQLAREVRELGSVHTLYASGDYVVMVAARAAIPHVMNEIGRLREVSFRAVGEGTGKARDLDDFDDWYQQLFVWQTSSQQVLGAYRLCMTDVVRRRQGDAGLYTLSLFDFQPGFLDELGPAIELGRSFVRLELQGAGRVLAFLWRGIGHLLAARPRYRRLFGPVSVSASYSEPARQLIASSLCSGAHRHALAPRVRALHPVQLSMPGESPEADVRQLARRVAELEPDQKGLPILVREYVKLGGQFLAFSVDPAFQAAMDGLVVVDLDRTSSRLLLAHMGPENYERFRNYVAPAAPAPTLEASPG
jgi:hypothetical protein